ncbi:MAG: hypothetical protein P0S94_02175 [Simkaniaceae bacterium]|nr:hypothetical protein [Simkaniaceae bacterium]
MDRKSQFSKKSQVRLSKLKVELEIPQYALDQFIIQEGPEETGGACMVLITDEGSINIVIPYHLVPDLIKQLRPYDEDYQRRKKARLTKKKKRKKAPAESAKKNIQK